MADTVEEYQRALEKEWGTYVATEVISVNGARAFNVGDAIPASTVESGAIPAGQYARKSTKAGQAAVTTE